MNHVNVNPKTLTIIGRVYDDKSIGDEEYLTDIQTLTTEGLFWINSFSKHECQLTTPDNSHN